MDTNVNEYDIPLEKFREAASLIRGKVLRAPLVPLPLTEGRLFAKCENLQPSGSFKIRGATYSVSKLSFDAKKRGVIAYSTGNHAQAVARACQLEGVPATIVMSPDAPAFKIERTKGYGANVIMTEPSSVVRRELAEELAKKDGLTIIAPYDDLNVIAGQGTIGLEIYEDIQPASVFVPVGGGGLISGIAMAIKKLNPKIKLVGVEPRLENDAFQSFQTGKRVRLKGASTSIADAIKIQELGKVTYPIMCQYVDEMVEVSEEEIKNALLLMLDRGHIWVEPSGALALAGALANPKYLKLGPCVTVASGGNVLLKSLFQLLS